MTIARVRERSDVVPAQCARRCTVLSRLMNDSGQDLIEYALLLAVVGTGLLLLGPTLEAAMQFTYESFSDAIYNLAQPREPG